jgi:hypothetical protein
MYSTVSSIFHFSRFGPVYPTSGLTVTRLSRVYFMMCYLKVPGLGKKRDAGLTYSILAAISLKIVSLGTYTVIPSFFLHFKITMKVIFLNAVEYRLQFPLDVRHCFKTSSLQFHFQCGKQSEITGGEVQRVGRMGNDNHVVVSHKLCGFQGRVGGLVVVMKESVVVASKFWSFSPHIFTQASQNVTVKVRVGHSVRRNKFMVNNPLHIEKKQ